MIRPKIYGEILEVIYSIGAKFGVGLGGAAYHAVSRIYGQGYLKKLICLSSRKTEIGSSKIKKIRSVYYLCLVLHGARKFLHFRFDPYPLQNMWYDYFASKHVEKCDIFHGWSGHSLLSSRRAKEIGAKTIIEVGSAHPLIVDKLLREEFRKYGVKTEPIPNFDRCCKELEECDYVAVPSNFVKGSFLERGFAEDKLIQFHYGVDFNKFKPTEKRDNIFRAIFVGSVILRKGVQYLLEAWDCLGLKNAELLICGLIHEDTEKIVKEYKQNKSIKFLGYASRVPYEDANVFILPSIEDGVGHVVGEAMACGLPVVVSENTGAKDLVESGENGFVVPIRDVKSLKEKILYFYDNPEITRRMGKNARKTVEKYTWTRYGNEVVKAYEKILTK